MHLLSAQAVGPGESQEAIDLEQTPAEIVLLSSADTELACLAKAHARQPDDAPTLRLANVLRLAHPMSVDLYVERNIQPARLVILRLLGGRDYWSYGLEQIAATCRRAGIAFAALPGDDQPDPELGTWSTLPATVSHRLWQYLVQGGVANAEQLLLYAGSLLGRDGMWREPAPLLRAGPYWPGLAEPTLEDLRGRWHDPAAPVAGLVFYRALVQAGDLEVIDHLSEALAAQGLNPLPLFVTSLKDAAVADVTSDLLRRAEARVILNATGFAVSAPGAARRPSPLEATGCPILQVVFSGETRTTWAEASRGLMPRDLAMNVALPEVDGRVLARAVGFKAERRFDPRTEVALVGFEPVRDRIDFTAALAAAWVRLGQKPPAERRVGIVLANYPNRDGRVANGVGLDAPQSTIRVLQALRSAGYRLEDMPPDAATLIERLLQGPTNALDGRSARLIRTQLPLSHYEKAFAALPEAARTPILDRWGEPEDDPHVASDAFALSILPLGRIVLGIQPSRGYHIDPVQSYHAPDLVPPHGYLAFHIWLREVFAADAIIHLGKHGNLEWLPGKAIALSGSCFPEVALGPVPNLYPFIVNDPGEGSQAKRRTSAVIVDHLTPPLARAETYGPLRDLEQLVDEYFEAAGVDPRRLPHLEREILERMQSLGLDRDLGVDTRHQDDALQKLDAHLCELKELQIRDGLHIFGEAPSREPLTSLLVALARLPRGRDEGGRSLLGALAADLDLDGFDPLAADLGAPWLGHQPAVLSALSTDPWRTCGDTVERLELLAAALVAGERQPEDPWTATRSVLAEVEQRLRPAVVSSGPAEIRGLLDALDARFVLPGPSGAPSRGRPDVLPTGRNFYSVDTRAVPTPAAWHLGWKSAALLVERYLQEQGDWPRAVALSAWGTANMRTGGDDLAQALALLGARPTWDGASHRVTGTEVLPLAVLDRPRIDVTLRVSGFFRDAFPHQIELFDQAVRAIAGLDEPEDLNPIAARVRSEADELERAGAPASEARRRAGYRVFGSKPGAYGAGLQALIDERGWESDADLARAYVAWGGYAYGSGSQGPAEHRVFERRLAGTDLVLHNQDNREHDLLDSDDYYQFEGGLAAAVRNLSGAQPEIYHNDHARPESPRIRPLREEIGRIVRARAANPKWLRGVMRHGYKGAFEIAATVDYLFAFAATSGVVENHHFEALFEAYLADDEVRAFMARNNPAALCETADRFSEAIERGLWHPRANTTTDHLENAQREGRAQLNRP